MKYQIVCDAIDRYTSVCYGLRSTPGRLAQHCQATGLPAPSYDYQPGRDGKIRATVTLANGMSIQGSYARNRDQAAESAAGIALLHLVSVDRTTVMTNSLACAAAVLSC